MREALESQLFSWHVIDDDGNGDYTFYVCELKISIGKFSIGSSFPTIIWDGTRSLITLVDEQSREYTFELKVGIGEEVSSDNLHDEHGDFCGCSKSVPPRV
jgi:hypothetical protein